MGSQKTLEIYTGPSYLPPLVLPWLGPLQPGWKGLLEAASGLMHAQASSALKILAMTNCLAHSRAQDTKENKGGPYLRS